MHTALFKLFTLSNKSAIRRTFRGARTVRGALLILFTLTILGLMIVPQIVAVIAMNGHPQGFTFVDKVEPFAPFGLLFFTMIFVFTSAGEKAITFSPAEIDFLFPAPFSRRDLLIYKLLKTAIGLVIMSLLFSIIWRIYFRSWLSGFAGLTLSLALLQLLGMVTALVGQIASESLYTRVRKIILAVVLVTLLAGLGQVARRVQAMGLTELIAGVRESQTLRVLLAPFEVFTRTAFAEAYSPAFWGWGATALAIDLGLLLLILRLDANYLESAAAISQKVYDRIRRAKAGGGLAMPASAGAGRFRLPRFPWLAGAGPIAWRQILVAIRTSRHVFIVYLGFTIVFLVGTMWIPTGPDESKGSWIAWMGVGMTAYLSFLFSMQSPWGFRGDVDHIDFLKTLPIHPMILTIGELAGGTLLLTAIHLIMFAAFAAAAPAGAVNLLIAGSFVLPIDALLLSLSNLIFLIYPVRPPTGGTVDFQAMSKWMLFAFIQMFFLLIFYAIPAGLGGIAYLVTNGWVATAFLTAWLVLIVELVPIVMLVGWAFRRFDVSTETPV